MKNIYLLLITLLIAINAVAETQPIPIADIKNFEHYSPIVKKLINTELLLTKMKLTYLYGSADPKNGGMDCSGTIYYLLNKLNVNDVPRQSDEVYEWALKHGDFHSVHGADFNSAEFSQLKPGDLLFWSGTYNVNRSVTHIMLYLGKTKDNKPIMFGASNGRTYQGRRMWGVSVFDFKLPNPHSRSRFLGYSCVPHLTCKAT